MFVCLTGGSRGAALDIRTPQEDAGVMQARLSLPAAVAAGLIVAVDAKQIHPADLLGNTTARANLDDPGRRTTTS
jgi:hypothetical protein